MLMYYRYLLDMREQIRHNSTEKFQVILQELWHVHISNGTQHNQFLERERRENIDSKQSGVVNFTTELLKDWLQ